MAKFDVFVGRQEELALIDKWAEEWGTLHQIAVHGDGGVGKTWLLLEILQRYCQRDDFVVVYSDSAEHPFSLQYETMFLARRLGQENFPQLLDGMAELTLDYYDFPIWKAQAREREVLQTGIQEINQVLQGRRLIFLRDTLEAWGPEIGRELNEYAAQLSNALFVSAGRNVREEIWPQLQRDYGRQQSTCIELGNFDRVESAEFFAAADTEEFIAPDIRAKLHFLTGGRPVLLSLAVEWLSQSVPLPEIAERSLTDLKALPEAELRDLRERFEFELVDRVQGLKSSLDRALLYMAHIARRNNARIMSLLLDISMSDARDLMQRLAELSFVKHNPVTGDCVLHDEMKNLINEHAWPYVDPDGDVRRGLARKVIVGYYEPRIRALEEQTRAQLESDRGPVRRAAIGAAEWEQWRLEAECLYYHLQVGAEEGFAYFDARFTEARRNNHLMRMQFLLNEVQAAGHAGIRDTLALRRAQELLPRGEVGQARGICRELLAKEDLSSDNRISAHNILGVIAASTDPEEARRQYESALQLAQREGKTRMIGELHNNLGQLYRRTSLLDQAVEHYQQAIEVSKEASNLPLVAAATNNLAYVYRLQGNLAQADVLCRVALAQRKRLGLERDLAYSYLTKGEIDRDRGDLESAERYTKLALRNFDKVSEIRGQALAHRSLANIRRHLERYEEAEAYLERGIALAERLHDESLLADLLSVYGREQRDRAVYLQGLGDGDGGGAADRQQQIQAFFQSAEKYLERSLELASRYGDQWLIARGRFELALTYFLSGSRSDDEVIVLLDQVWAQVSGLEDKLLQGYVHETQGEIAQRRQDYAAAAGQFGLAAQLIAQRRGRESERFFDRLGDRLLDPRLPPEAARTLAQGILDVIQQMPVVEVSLQSLQMLCQQVLGSM